MPAKTETQTTDTQTTDTSAAKTETAPRSRIHPEIISPLVDLWRATGDARYLEAARTQGEALLAELAPPAPPAPQE